MPIPTYTPGYPPDGSSLGQTKAVIRNNLDGTFQTLGVDHINNNGDPGAQPAGYHNIIHQVVQSADPTPIADVNQVYAKNYTPDTSGGVQDTQLFNMTGLGGVSQLTGNNATALSGWVWAGGLLFQWGAISILTTTANGTITFQTRATPSPGGGIPFPNNCFQVVAGYLCGNGVTSVGSATVAFNTLTKTSVKYVYTSAGGAALNNTGFAWLAIGN